jgi:hypothetical protein
VRLGTEAPDASEESLDPDDASVREIAPLIPRSDEQQVHAGDVGAVLGDVAIGVHDVPPALAHLRAVLGEHPVEPKVRERLGE